MSEFVECQNCGRKFFAENIDCPYCRDEQEARERTAELRGASSAGGMYGVLFTSFMMVLAGVALLASLSMPRSPAGSPRLLLGLESLLALVTLAGLAARRRWARLLAILYILANAAVGVLALIGRGQVRALAWGPGPTAMLLFLLPFFSPQARDRFSR